MISGASRPRSMHSDCSSCSSGAVVVGDRSMYAGHPLLGHYVCVCLHLAEVGLRPVSIHAHGDCSCAFLFLL
jgi:hypothetical protein